MRTSKSNVLIKVSNIHPHPDNPRKDVGDVTELAESIKKNGIMQNLTVIPIGCLADPADEQTSAEEISKKSEFHVLIGHRRLAAAVEAGIETVPCTIISNIDRKEQISIMLEENMQREDLTIPEQAQGFQMMLDLGYTVDDIQEKTGFAKSTIYHRVNLAKLDKDVLEEKSKKYQLTLQDLYELEKLSSVEDRNEILIDATNSNDIKWRVESRLRAIKKQKDKEAFIKKIKDAGLVEVEEIKKDSDINKLGYQRSTCRYIWDYDKAEVTEDLLEQGKYFCFINDYLYILCEKKEEEIKELTEEKKAIKEREKEKEDRENKLKAMAKDCVQELKEFTKSAAEGKIPIPEDRAILQKLWSILLLSNGDGYVEFDPNYICEVLYGDPLEEEEYKKQLKKMKEEQLELIFMVQIVSNIYVSEIIGYKLQGYSYQSEKSKYIREYYEFIKQYGFSFSKEESDQILHGTHEYYITEEKEHD